MAKYSMKVAWSDEDDLFVATCPELGDISALAPTYEQAVAELQTAIDLAIETYDAEGMPIPEPQKVEKFSGQFRLRLPKFLHAWLSREAERQGVSLNSLATSMLAQAKGRLESRHSSTRSALAPPAFQIYVSWSSYVPGLGTGKSCDYGMLSGWLANPIAKASSAESDLVGMQALGGSD